jgi:hypothetical protein
MRINRMIQADRVLSTQPTNTPVDTTRRRFLNLAAAGSIATLAPAIAVPAALSDPVFGLIDAHRKAEAAHLAAIKELDRLDKTPGFKDWDVTEQPCRDEFNAFDVLLAAAATTLPGILAKLALPSRHRGARSMDVR